MHDEMTIQSDLVFDPVSEEIVGFLERTEASEKLEEQELATLVLVFYVYGLNFDLSMSMGFFPTKGANADSLYSKLWGAIGWLEMFCGLKVSL